MRRAEDGGGVFRVERHELGPRLYVLGRRVHECHAGIVIAAIATGSLLARWPLPAPLGLATLAIGAWLVWKDWHDLLPSKRDTTAWRVGAHSAPTPLRARGR